MEDYSLKHRHWALILFAFVFIMLPGIDHGIWRPMNPM